MAGNLYRWLAGGARGDPADRHVFACALALGLTEADRPLGVALGLSTDQLAALSDRIFPHAAPFIAGHAGDEGEVSAAIEEPDLRRLLLDHRSRGAAEETWLAHIIARRSQGANHLWQDLGLTSRADLGGLMKRHFAPLAAKNSRDMKWKKFFYRELCQLDGIPICKAPTCDSCSDFGQCFGGEEGDPVGALRPQLVHVLSLMESRDGEHSRNP